MGPLDCLERLHLITVTLSPTHIEQDHPPGFFLTAASTSPLASTRSLVGAEPATVRARDTHSLDQRVSDQTLKQEVDIDREAAGWKEQSQFSDQLPDLSKVRHPHPQSRRTILSRSVFVGKQMCSF